MGNNHYSDEIIREYQHEAMMDYLDKCDSCKTLYDPEGEGREGIHGMFCSVECAEEHAKGKIKRIRVRLHNNVRVRIVAKIEPYQPLSTKIMYFNEWNKTEFSPQEVANLFADRRHCAKVMAALTKLFAALDAS
jgi:hypothetical protein